MGKHVLFPMVLKKFALVVVVSLLMLIALVHGRLAVRIVKRRTLILHLKVVMDKHVTQQMQLQKLVLVLIVAVVLHVMMNHLLQGLIRGGLVVDLLIMLVAITVVVIQEENILLHLKYVYHVVEDLTP